MINDRTLSNSITSMGSNSALGDSRTSAEPLIGMECGRIAKFSLIIHTSCLPTGGTYIDTIQSGCPFSLFFFFFLSFLFFTPSPLNLVLVLVH